MEAAFILITVGLRVDDEGSLESNEIGCWWLVAGVILGGMRMRKLEKFVKE